MKHGETRPNREEQNETDWNMIKQNRTGSNNMEQDDIEWDRKKQDGA